MTLDWNPTGDGNGNDSAREAREQAEFAGAFDSRSNRLRDPFESEPRPPLSMKEQRAEVLAEHMANHQGKLLTECADGELTLTYDWAGEDNWRGKRGEEGRAVVRARSNDLLDTMQCVIAQVNQGIEFHPFDAGLVDFNDPRVYAAATEYYAGPGYEQAAEYYAEAGYEPPPTSEALIIDPDARANGGVRQINPAELLPNGYKEIGRSAAQAAEQIVFYGNDPNGLENGPATAVWWHYNRDAMGQFMSGPAVILGGQDGERTHSVPRDAIEVYGDIVTGRYYTGFDIADYAIPESYQDESVRDNSLRRARDGKSYGIEL
jgi:hypothetical protein